MKKNNVLFAKRGSVALEMAVTAPIFILAMIFILHLVLCIRSEILLLQAVDQVTSEMAVAAPILSQSMDPDFGALGQNLFLLSEGTESQGRTMGGIRSVLEAFDMSEEDVFGTFLLGTSVRDRILSYFYSYDDGTYPMHSIADVSVLLDFENEEKRINMTVFYVRKTLFGPEKREINSHIPLFSPLLLSGPANGEGEHDNSTVWDLGNFQRGGELGKKFGANLPHSYPVIASWDGGTVTSIKSIDLTAPTYQSREGIEKKISEHLRDISDFSGTDRPWGKEGIHIRGEDIKQKKLLLIIPENTSGESLKVLLDMEKEAAGMGIALVWEKYEISYKYGNKETESGSKTNDIRLNAEQIAG